MPLNPKTFIQSPHNKPANKFGFCTILTVIFMISVHAIAGGGSDGGGSLCFNRQINNGVPVLLDFVDKNNMYSEPPSTPEFDGTEEYRFIPKEFIHNLESYTSAKTLIQKWIEKQPSSKALNLLLNTLDSMVFSLDPNITEVIGASIDVNSKCQINSLVPVAHYSSGIVKISPNNWNFIGMKSRIGVFIHETLRQIQILHRLWPTDSELQEMTRFIVLKTPTPAPQIDDMPFFKNLISKTFNLSKENLKQKFCEDLKRFLNETTDSEQIVQASKNFCLSPSSEFAEMAHNELFKLFWSEPNVDTKNRISALSKKLTEYIVQLEVGNFEFQTYDIMNSSNSIFQETVDKISHP
ncbi:MAG: hypothetical protein ACXVCY_15100 [Pseudobdellovibrionaceae bacterium]